MESLNKFMGELSPAIRFEDRDKEFLVALCYELQANWLAEQKAGMSLSCEYEQQAAENAALKEQVAQLQTIIREEATDSGNVILELATANETIAALKEQIAQLEREFKIEFGDLHDSYIEQKETIAEQADELSESQKHINHLRMALADAEALELGTCERLAKARSMLAEQAEASMLADARPSIRRN